MLARAGAAKVPAPAASRPVNSRREVRQEAQPQVWKGQACGVASWAFMTAAVSAVFMNRDVTQKPAALPVTARHLQAEHLQALPMSQWPRIIQNWTMTLRE
jgi:hypothetical protein